MQRRVVVQMQAVLVIARKNAGAQTFAFGVVDAVIHAAQGVAHKKPEILARVRMREYLTGCRGISKPHIVATLKRVARDAVIVRIINIKMARGVHREIARDEEISAFDARAQHLAAFSEGHAEYFARRK